MQADSLSAKPQGKQVRWSGIPISGRIFQLIVIHPVKSFGVNKAEVDVFPELRCFSYDPTNVGNLISGSSAFSNFFFFISLYVFIFFLFFPFIFISWRLITLQYCSGFCHTLT